MHQNFYFTIILVIFNFKILIKNKIIMDNFFKGIGLSVAAIVILAIMAVISGTIVYWIWPIAIPAAFPGLVATGVIAAKLEWWAAVCLTWLFSILIKSSTVNNN